MGSCHTLQVGSYAAETLTWTRPEDMTTSRLNITISVVNATSTAAADLIGNAAAALAAASMVWDSVNSAYAAQALLAAKDLYTFAQSVSTVQLLSLSCSVFTGLIGVVYISQAACCALKASAESVTQLLNCPVKALQVQSTGAACHVSLTCDRQDLLANGCAVANCPCSVICALYWLQALPVPCKAHTVWGLSCVVMTGVCEHRCQGCILRSIQMRPCHILLPRIWMIWLMLQHGCTFQHR